MLLGGIDGLGCPKQIRYNNAQFHQIKTWVNEDRNVRVGVSTVSRATSADTTLDLTGVLNDVGDTFEPLTTFGFGFVLGSITGGFDTSLGSGGGTLS